MDIMFTKLLRIMMRYEASMNGHCVGDDAPSRTGHCY